MLFFIAGFVLLHKERAKPAADRSTAVKVLAFVLMGVGMTVGFGFGAGTFFGELGMEL
jgi:hypothetical protein